MTLQEAKDCLSRKDCEGCKFYNSLQDHKDMQCFHAAEEIGVTAIMYLIMGTKLADEAENKLRN